MTEKEQITILLVCQTGSHIGLGHLSRILVAVRLLHLEGYNLQLLLQTDNLNSSPSSSYVTETRIDFTQSLDDTIMLLANKTNCRLVIFDLHPKQVPEQFPTLLKTLHSKRIGTIAIDALAEYSELLSLVYTPSFRPSDKLTPEQQQQSTFGWDCFLLNVAKQTNRHKSDALLVLTGGADTTKLGDHWLKQLDLILPQYIDFHWVQGPFATAPVLPDDTNRRITIHRGLNDLSSLMNEVRYAATLYGISFYELLYYGVPTVVFSPYGDKDNAELAAINELQVALVAQDEQMANLLLLQLTSSPEQIETLSKRASALFTHANGQRLIKSVRMVLDQL